MTVPPPPASQCCGCSRPHRPEVPGSLIVPLIRVTSDRQTMSVFVTARWMKGVVQAVAAITGLNGWLLLKTVESAGGAQTGSSGWQLATGIGAMAGAVLLLWIAVVPLRRPADEVRIGQASNLA